MRQAGRYLPEYRQVRSRHSFWEMVRNPAVAAEVTFQPIRRFGMDAAILFSDILVVPDAMGITVTYDDGPPKLSPLVRDAAGLQALKQVNPAEAFAYVGEAMERLCRELHPQTAVLGFAGAPFTLAAYMVEGGPSKDVHDLKVMALREPGLYAELAGRITDVVIDLLKLQVKAGADAVQVFDTWALHLSPDQYAELALPYTRRVVTEVSKTGVPVICYARNAAGLLEEVAKTGCHVLSVDGSLRLAEARRRLAPGVGLQGNVDVALLSGPHDAIRAKVRELVLAMQGTPYIVNLGHGVVPGTPPEGVAALVDAVREGGA
jgi:uroporphyrinogen decarboxylase